MTRSADDDTSPGGRLGWFLLGAGFGAAVTALLDPETGRRRRHRLQDRAERLSREVADELLDRADYAAGAARGAAVETAKEAVPDTALQPEDPGTLRQRIRSEVIGHVDGSDDVVVAVHAEGRVSLMGTVANEDVERRLVEETRGVPGVTSVTSELTITG